MASDWTGACMVLKACAWILIGAFSLNVMALDPKVYDKALDLQQKGHKDTAVRLLETNYNLRSRDLPVKVATLATSLLMSLKRWYKAEQVADVALNANWPGWQTKKPAKANADFWWLLKAATEAKTQIFESGDQSRNRGHLKAEIKAYSDLLATNSSHAENAKQMQARVDMKIENDKADAYHLDWSLSASYWTWEDRPSFDYQVAAKAKLFTPCFGFGLDYTDDFVHWAGGACAGAGSASIEFNDTHNVNYDNRGSVLLIAGYGSALLKLSNSGAAFGVETDLLNVTTSGKTADGTKRSASNEQFAVTAVGRYRFGKLDVKFKGGPVISVPSALWSFELGYVF